MEKYKHSQHLHAVAPVPVWYRILNSDDVGQDMHAFNNRLQQIAHQYYQQWQVEVPDEKHLCKSQLPPSVVVQFQEKKTFSQIQNPAIGKWHAVKTNDFLDVPEPETQLLRNIILNDYRQAVTDFYNSFDHTYLDANLKSFGYHVDESWIQFYKNGDYKVLHNHLKYGFDPKFMNIWAGGYYITDGQPDKMQPYAGKFSFRVRDYNYYVHPTPGMLMMWPGDVLHEVHPFYGESERVAINFNLSMR